jgi:hypothetical protein
MVPYRPLSKTNLSTKTFKSQAHPLHISITHTPPPVVEGSSENVPAKSTDSGFLAALSLQPSSFSTGTYGWKGSKRVTIEVDNPDTGEKEKLQVQLTCVFSCPHTPNGRAHMSSSFNATVLGSKGKDGEDEETKGEGNGDRDEERGEAEKEDKEEAQEE